jgi:pSer/pThr/pTyr-binding forkhead associated (FHA) protein
VAGVDALPSGSALLVVKRGPNAGSRFLLDRDTTSAGRHPDSDIFLDDVTVSRRHAEFRREGGEFVVIDVGSLNGTYVNREPVDQAVLAGGDEVQIGKFRLVFLTGPASGS